MSHYIPLVSVIIITYDRINILEKTITSFLKNCTYPRERLELILCDDGSPPEIQALMHALPVDKFLFSKKNKGLGNNTNKGIIESEGDYILQLQDDFELQRDGNFLWQAVLAMQKFPEVGMIRFEPIPDDFPIQGRLDADGAKLLLLAHDQKRIMESHRYSAYTDRPHLKSRAFHKNLGLYKERVPMTVMEVDFLWRVAKQDTIKIGYLPDLQPFLHTGTLQSFNPSHKREQLKSRLLRNPVIAPPLRLYLGLKKRIKSAL